ncbi:MAG: helix-turn-helix transcriptional regulator [Bryobacterales bacterium]|nr:helix-turn-helix transcriptional regulator [Bryobacterales bacterium]
MLPIDRVFHALGDPTRRAMVEYLSAGPLPVTRLAEPFPMSLAAVMQHVRILEASGLLKTEKTGRVRTCRVEPAGFAVVDEWVRRRRANWNTRFDRLEGLLRE